MRGDDDLTMNQEDYDLPRSGYSGDLTPAKIRDKYAEATRHLRKEQYDYQVNRSFIAGEQWVYWDSSRNTIQQMPREPARTQVTMNRLWPASRHIISRVLSRNLHFEVPPADADDATIRGAQTARSVVDDLKREHNWEQLREETAWNTWLGGTSALAIDWDASAGPTLGQLPMSGKPFGTGEIKESALSVLEIAWEPGIRDAEKSYWWIKAQALPPCEVQATFDLSAEPKADAQAAGTPLMRRLSVTDSGDAPVDLCLVLTYYERPSPKNPKGMVATVVGNHFVDGPKPWPFPWKDRLNLVIFRETKVSGRATGDTVFSAAVPVQAAYNASWSNIIEHLKLAGNARLLVPDAALDGVDELTDLPGEIVTYNSAAGAPAYLSPPQLAQWVLEQPLALAAQMDDILGIHDVSRGQAPTNIESGLGLSVLVEQDTTPLGSMTKELASGFERFASLALRLYEEKVTEPRKASIQTTGQVPETIRWTGEALAGQTRAIVPLDAVMPRSKAAQLAMARELWDRQIIQDPKEFARIADLPDQEDLLEGTDMDAAKAIDENHLMAIGDIQIPADFDDHEIHIVEHNRFRKTKRYRAMSAAIQAIYDDHVQAHETMMAEEMGLEFAKMQANPAMAAVATSSGTKLPPGMVPGMGGQQGGGANFAQPMEPLQPFSERGSTGPLSGAGQSSPGGTPPRA